MLLYIIIIIIDSLPEGSSYGTELSPNSLHLPTRLSASPQLITHSHIGRSSGIIISALPEGRYAPNNHTSNPILLSLPNILHNLLSPTGAIFVLGRMFLEVGPLVLPQIPPFSRLLRHAGVLTSGLFSIDPSPAGAIKI